MQVGYVLSTPDLTKVLCLAAGHDGVELASVDSTLTLNRSICLSDLTEIKNVYGRLQEKGLADGLQIVNVARLYKNFY